MRHYTSHGLKKPALYKKKPLEWLMYLPGAVIISYGLWLSLTL